MEKLPVRYIYPYTPPEMLPGKGLVRVPGTNIGSVRSTIPGPKFGNIQPPNFIEGEFSRIDTRPVVSDAAPQGGVRGTTSLTPQPRVNFSAAPDPVASVQQPNSAPIRGIYDVPRLSAPESLASKVAGNVATAGRFLAGGTVPTLAGSIATDMYRQENPINAMSPKERMQLAEADPHFYAVNKELIDNDIKQHNTLSTVNQALFGGGLLGFKVDPKAAALPNEAIPAYLGRRIREATVDSLNPIIDAGKAVAEPVKQFGTSLFSPTTVQPPAETQSGSSQMPAKLDSAMLSPSAGITVQTTPIGRMGALERRDYTVPGGTATGVLPAGSARGGFVGAATDAEAAKNLQARFAQDEAAKTIAANMDRGTEALRDLRAEQLGVTRSALDSAEGRAKGTVALPATPSPFSQPGDSFGDEVLRRDQLVRDINNPRASRTDRKAAADIYNSYIEAAKPGTVNTTPSVNPVDLQRFLLDQQRFNWQQGLDKSKLNLDAANISTKIAGQDLAQSKYADAQRAAFLKDFLYPDENAPQAELGALTWQLSKSTNGTVPPELMLNYIKKAADMNGVDWKNAPPKSLTELGKKAMELAKADLQ